MSVKHAVLGLVIERPGYGYELTQRFEERIGSWRTVSTGVYPALQTLHRRGSIRQREDGSAHRNVTWYEATDQGRSEFRSWVREPPALMPLRDDMFIKIAFATPEDLELLVKQTRKQEQMCLDRIGRLTGTGVGVSALLEAGTDWRPIGQAWLMRTEVAQLATTIERLQEARKLMKDAIARRAAERVTAPD